MLAVKFVGLRGETAILNWDVPIEIGLDSGAVGRPATESVELDGAVHRCARARDQDRRVTPSGAAGEWDGSYRFPR